MQPHPDSLYLGVVGLLLYHTTLYYTNLPLATHVLSFWLFIVTELPPNFIA